MPFDYGLRLDNRQRIANARAKPIEANKNQSVDGTEGSFLRSGSPQNVYLLPQHPNFCLKRGPRLDQIDDHPNNEPDKISHHATASPDSRSTASQIGFATGTGPGRAAIEFAHERGRHVEDVMTRDPITVDEQAPLDKLVRIMERKGIKRLPVMSGKSLVEIVTRTNILQAVASLAKEIPDPTADD